MNKFIKNEVEKTTEEYRTYGYDFHIFEVNKDDIMNEYMYLKRGRGFIDTRKMAEDIDEFAKTIKNDIEKQALYEMFDYIVNYARIPQFVRFREIQNEVTIRF